MNLSGPDIDVKLKERKKECRTIHNLARIMSDPRKNNKMTNIDIQDSSSEQSRHDHLESH
jgi:hypothetical protein